MSNSVTAYRLICSAAFALVLAAGTIDGRIALAQTASDPAANASDGPNTTAGSGGASGSSSIIATQSGGADAAQGMTPEQMLKARSRTLPPPPTTEPAGIDKAFSTDPRAGRASAPAVAAGNPASGSANVAPVASVEDIAILRQNVFVLELMKQQEQLRADINEIQNPPKPAAKEEKPEPPVKESLPGLVGSPLQPLAPPPPPVPESKPAEPHPETLAAIRSLEAQIATLQAQKPTDVATGLPRLRSISGAAGRFRATVDATDGGYRVLEVGDDLVGRYEVVEITRHDVRIRSRQTEKLYWLSDIKDQLGTGPVTPMASASANAKPRMTSVTPPTLLRRQ